MQDKSIVYPRPGPGTRTGRVWEVADEITRETGRRASRGAVIDRIVAEAGNPATASTQYQYWKVAQDLGEQPEQPAATSKRAARKRGRHYDVGGWRPPDPARAELPDVGARPLKIGGDGRVVVPEEMREAMLLDGEGRVTARVARGELRLVSRAVAIKHMQLEARDCKAPGESVVDEFLANRREMWGED